MRFAMPIVLIAGILAAPAAAAQAAPDYLGTWVIEASTPAPWIKSDAELFEEERVALVGKRIVLSRRDITGPPPMGCKGPHYRIRRYPADMLFQGGLTEPAAQATALGFSGRSIATLETGCEGLLDYHFIDGGTAMFALNNAIYLIRKTR
jgi:hypothetical protein